MEQIKEIKEIKEIITTFCLSEKTLLIASFVLFAVSVVITLISRKYRKKP